MALLKQLSDLLVIIQPALSLDMTVITAGCYF